MLKNTKESFGLISKTLHWSMAVILVGLFAVGLYMTDLDYYDALIIPYHGGIKVLAYWSSACWFFGMFGND